MPKHRQEIPFDSNRFEIKCHHWTGSLDKKTWIRQTFDMKGYNSVDPKFEVKGWWSKAQAGLLDKGRTNKPRVEGMVEAGTLSSKP